MRDGGVNNMKNYKIAVAGTGYVGLSIATLLSQHHQVTAVDIVPEKVELINNRKSPIQDDYIEKYLAEKELNLTAKLIHSRRLVKSYPRLWFAGFASRPSCYACSFKEEDRVSDFTLFDSFKSAGQYGFKDDDICFNCCFFKFWCKCC